MAEEGGMRWKWAVAGFAVILASGLYLINASWLAPKGTGAPLLLANRGVAQHYSHEELTNSSCTAHMIVPPTHDYIENTIRSIDAAFRFGADLVELQIQPTSDGKFAVFHDWTLDCRTNGHGPTRQHDMAYLKTLDIGYGYTADNGKTYPLRGKGIGLMPSLDEVFARFPHHRFALMMKSDDPDEGKMLADWLARLPDEKRRRTLIFSGGRRPAAIVRARFPDMQVMDKASTKSCLLGYAALGWSGYVPTRCGHSVILLPVNYTWLMAGWPNRFITRMDKVDTAVFLTESLRRDQSADNTDNSELLDAIPPNYAGGIWTDRVEIIGPNVHRLLAKGPRHPAGLLE